MTCRGSIVAMLSVPTDEGGSTPTPRLQKADWIVAACDEEIGHNLIRQYHYAHSAPRTSVFIYGLFPKGWVWFHECVGVTWWLPPTKAVAVNVGGDDWRGVLTLSRLMLTPEVPRMGCSFLLSKSVRMIPVERWPVLVTYADSWRGHAGTIYKACGWEDRGETEPLAVYTKDGQSVSKKMGPKTRNHAEMLALGCTFEGKFTKRKFVLDRRKAH